MGRRIEPASLAWKSNAEPFSQLATRYLVVNTAIAILRNPVEDIENENYKLKVRTYKNSSKDEIANVNFLRRYRTYVLQNTKEENLLRLTN